MANDPDFSGPPPDQPTPPQLRQRVIHNPRLFWETFWGWFGPRMEPWARAQLRNVGVLDRDTADDVVQRIVVRLMGHWNFDPALGSLTHYLRRAVSNEVLQELRRRRNRGADYGAAPGDNDLLRALGDSFEASLGDLDTDWRHVLRDRTRAAVARARQGAQAHEWEVFLLYCAEGRTGPEVVREVNRRFALPQPLKQAQVYPIKVKLSKIVHAELRAAGIDPSKEPPEVLGSVIGEALRDARGEPGNLAGE
jgi:DNA-directed RNA polymerase specialized sigma24 family protein